MKKDMIFFATDGKGLTSTSANHIANLAKEMISETDTVLEEMTLYSTTVSLIGGDKPNVLNRGANDSDVESTITLLRRVAEAKSLIAWLREAIKAKERLLQELTDETLEEYAKEAGIKLNEQPKLKDILTEDEYFASRSVDERCRYYSVETLAATLGKAIHPGGTFAEARKELQAKGKKPHDVEGTGRDTLIYTYTPTVSEKVVEDVYFRLQAEYRDAQSQVNSMKHDCRKAIEESAIAARTEYAKAMAEWNNERKLVEARHAEHIQIRSKELEALRIRIPQSLTGIYEHASGLGKKRDNRSDKEA
ncbi:MAG: hypothetical protein JFT09_08240 [Muribaculaceae bacterium]|nr:hypothetical protein [Muribaculaceae bacterium]